MKCHWCQEEIRDVGIDPDDMDFITKECPGGHAIIRELDGKVMHYIFYVDREETRYRIEGWLVTDFTTLYSKDVPATRTKDRIKQDKRYSEVLRVPKFIWPSVKDDILQVELMMDKIQKLVVFS